MFKFNLLTNHLQLERISEESRIVLVRKTVCLFFIVGICMSYPLWISDRLFPLTVVFEGMPIFQSPFDKILLIALIILLALELFSHSNIACRIIVGIIFILALQDQNRWQPWAYMYLLALVPYILPDNLRQNTVATGNYMRLLLIGIYLWSGIHKLNPNFINFTFKNILSAVFEVKNQLLIDQLSVAGYIIPCIEIGFGISLIFPGSRNIGVILAIGSHLFILLYLSPWGVNTNYIVYPWNLAMILLVGLLFYDVRNKVDIWKPLTLHGKLAILSVVLTVWVFPILNLFGYWDHYLSFSLYSDKIRDYYIAVEANELAKIDKHFNAYFVKIEGLQGGQIIDINKWSMEELQVPFYPEIRVFKQISKSFCKLGIAEEKIIFLAFERPLSKGKYISFTCSSLHH